MSTTASTAFTSWMSDDLLAARLVLEVPLAVERERDVLSIELPRMFRDDHV
jgi:hypothetical protein